MGRSAEPTVRAVCAACGAVNRYRAGSGARAVCGRCRGPLFGRGPVEVDATGFDRHVTESDVPVVVDIWAPWCGPCRAMAPGFAAAADRLEPAVRFLKLNADAEPGIADRLRVRGIPTTIVFRGGHEVARKVGAMSPEDVLGWISRAVGSGTEDSER